MCVCECVCLHLTSAECLSLQFLEHTLACVSMGQDTSGYVRIRQHTLTSTECLSLQFLEQVLLCTIPAVLSLLSLLLQTYEY